MSLSSSTGIASAADRGLPGAALRRPAWEGVALIVLATCVAYLPAITGQFVRDDHLLIANNDLIKYPGGLNRIWFSTDALDYWPVTYSTFWLEWRLWGVHPVGYHLTNVALLIAAALLVWAVLRELAIPGALLAALLYAVHPVNVEAVAWIAQRKTILATVFFLTSIWCYLKSEQPQPTGEPSSVRKGRPWYWLSLAAFLLGMLSKGSIATLPLVLLGIAWWQRQRITKSDLMRTAPYFLIAAGLALVNIWFQTHGSGETFRNVGPLERLLGAAAAIWFYLGKALLPIQLTFIYPQWDIRAGNVAWWLPLLAAIGVTVLLWRERKRPWCRAMLLAWGYFCVTLLPVLGFADVSAMQFSLVADHYQNVALVGVTALVAAAWSVWYQRASSAVRPATLAMAAVVVVLLTGLSWAQSRLYQTPTSLLLATIERNPDCWAAYDSLGLIEKSQGHLPDAVQHMEQALRLNPDYAEAHFNLGCTLAEMGQTDDAVAHLENALRLRPNYVEAHNQLGVVLTNRGQAQQAVEHYTAALALRPGFAEAHNNLGSALVALDRTPEALEHFQKAVALKPDLAVAWYNLASAQLNAEHTPEAIEAFQAALRLDPNYTNAHFNLAVALFNAGRPQEGLMHLQMGLSLEPDFAEGWANLAEVHARFNHPAEAQAAAQRALDLARAKGNTTLAEQMEAWLAAYRAVLPSGASVVPVPALPP